MQPTFSICIPAYKNIRFLERLIQSCLEQTFTQFEVVITDDSPEDTLGNWLKNTYQDSRIRYHKNPQSLGTPANWNKAISLATGMWIKLMHDDDWFSHHQVLQQYATAISKQPKASIFYSAYTNYFLETQTTETVRSNVFRRWWVHQSPVALYARNVIGPPSVLLVEKQVAARLPYDERMKWLVDIDYYMGVIPNYGMAYLSEPLIHVGISSQQVTVDCLTNPEVEIPEALLLHQKHLSLDPLRDILYFDGWWRLIRNLKIRNIEAFTQYCGHQTPPTFIGQIIASQNRLNHQMLQNGFYSKFHMFRCWLKQKH